MKFSSNFGRKDYSNVHLLVWNFIRRMPSMRVLATSIFALGQIPEELGFMKRVAGLLFPFSTLIIRRAMELFRTQVCPFSLPTASTQLQSSGEPLILLTQKWTIPPRYVTGTI